MNLTADTRIGPYRILEALEARGRGELYRAVDSGNGRGVVLKLLRGRLVSDEPMRQDLQKKARAVSDLSHPHVGGQHQVVLHDGVVLLVMDDLEGETLAERIERGPIPIEELVTVGIQVTDALCAAHREGLVHGNLDPQNVILTDQGARVLEWGLTPIPRAVETSDVVEAEDWADRSRAARALAHPYRYAAPELLVGQPADSRSDIFSLGEVLAEMAEAVRPFAPAALQRLVRTCTAQDPARRRQSMDDVLAELQWIAEAAADPRPVAAAPDTTRSRLWLVSVAGIVLASATLAMIASRPFQTRPAAIRASILAPDGWSFTPIGPRAGPVAASPSGRNLAFVASGPEGRRLFVRTLKTLEARELPGTDGAHRPFWSPDERYVGFFADGKLKKVDVVGGSPITLCDAPDGRGGSWSVEDAILFAPRSRGPLYRVSAAGGEPVRVTELDAARGEQTHRFPWFLPDGRYFLYLVRTSAATTGAGGSQLYIGSLDSSTREFLFNATSGAVYASGNLLYVRDGRLIAQPFDPKRQQQIGQAVQLAENVLVDEAFGAGVFSVSNNGVLAYQNGPDRIDSILRWVDHRGREQGLVGEPNVYRDMELSPNGKKLLLRIDNDDESGGSDLWVRDLARNTLRRLTRTDSDEASVEWSPDGKRVAFSSTRNGTWGIYTKDTAGTGEVEPLLQLDGVHAWPSGWSPDGKHLLYTMLDLKAGTKSDVAVLSVEDAESTPLVRTPAEEYGGRFSPDGRWVAYASDETGRQEIYVTSLGEPDTRLRLSDAGGDQPRWSPDGKTVYFLALDDGLMAVDVDASRFELEVGAPRRLFELHPALGGGTLYAVSPDGVRFLVNSSRLQESPLPLTLVLNWTSELDER